MSENLIPVFVMLFVFGFPVAAFIVTRFLRHAERMEFIKRGMMPPPELGGKGYKAWQQSGAPYPHPTVVPVPPPGWSPEDDPQRALYRGIRTAFIGLAILIGLSFFGGTPGSRDFHGGPWLLGGLIPMFVGIAQVIIALLSGAELPGVQSRGRFVPPPPGGRPGPGVPPPGFNGAAPPPPPWVDQPGRQRFEELSKPVPPPDVR
ncbi:MAG: hypothetical protein QOJ39_228 [Candidatus Eremiobacteraeota bacterium]|jgi:hypothetical protein|nr:hypothetical protein [Candidatus Eremiobacteraeota bacterium]